MIAQSYINPCILHSGHFPMLVHVHFSCQFVVSTSGDYTIHSGDPDRLVEWDCIEQVVSQDVI